jgi:phosphoglycerate dehydrogenase-like enzyme
MGPGSTGSTQRLRLALKYRWQTWPGQNSGTVAEYVIGLIIALQRRIFVADREIKAGQYAAARRDLFKQGLNEITGSRLGIVGMGAIGRRVAKLAGILGASVMYHDLYRAGAQLALADALETGHLHGAAIDTVSPEPPPPDHPLLNLSPAARDRLILTPHIAGITDQAFGRLLNHALANISRVASGKPPENVVNGVFAARPGNVV